MFTSAVTLVVAAVITVGPLQSRLRAESATALRESTEARALGLGTQLSKNKLKASDKPDARYAEKAAEVRARRAPTT